MKIVTTVVLIAFFLSGCYSAPKKNVVSGYVATSSTKSEVDEFLPAAHRALEGGGVYSFSKIYTLRGRSEESPDIVCGLARKDEWRFGRHKVVEFSEGVANVIHKVSYYGTKCDYRNYRKSRDYVLSGKMYYPEDVAMDDSGVSDVSREVGSEDQVDSVDVEDSEIPGGAFCSRVSVLSKEFMRARQKGLPLTNSLRIAEGNSLIESMVMLAYKKPRYSTERYQREAITEFQNEMTLHCIEARPNG